MKKTTARFMMASTALVCLFTVRTAFGHVTVAPRYSDPGAELTYSVRVPTERPGATVRVEAEFPAEVVVVVFDPAKVRDNATFTDPHQYATGFRLVLVNGEPVIENDQHTGAGPGQIIRRGK